MSNLSYQYASLPQFKYQTYDWNTGQFKDCPISSLYSSPPSDDGNDEPTTDAKPKKDVPLDQQPQDAPAANVDAGKDALEASPGKLAILLVAEVYLAHYHLEYRRGLMYLPSHRYNGK